MSLLTLRAADLGVDERGHVWRRFGDRWARLHHAGRDNTGRPRFVFLRPCLAVGRRPVTVDEYHADLVAALTARRLLDQVAP